MRKIRKSEINIALADMWIGIRIFLGYSLSFQVEARLRSQDICRQRRHSV
jgi:hypothetical protein